MMVQLDTCAWKYADSSLSVGQKKPDVHPPLQKVKGATIVTTCMQRGGGDAAPSKQPVIPTEVSRSFWTSQCDLRGKDALRRGRMSPTPPLLGDHTANRF